MLNTEAMEQNSRLSVARELENGNQFRKDVISAWKKRSLPEDGWLRVCEVRFFGIRAWEVLFWRLAQCFPTFFSILCNPDILKIERSYRD